MNIDRSAIMFGPDGAWSREIRPEFLTGGFRARLRRLSVRHIKFRIVRLAFIESLVEITLCPRTAEAGVLAASGAVVVRIRYLNLDGAERSDFTLPLRGR
jgi:hypothetical protein